MRNLIIVAGTIAALIVVGIGAYIYVYQSDKVTKTPSITPQESENTTNSTDNEIEQTQPSLTTYMSAKGIPVEVTSPARDSKVDSPLNITGSVPGSWSHEAQFTIRLLDKDGLIVAEAPATIDGEWMTEEMMPFQANLTFTVPPSETGNIVLVKANPSDMPENADTVVVPIRFTE